MITFDTSELRALSTSFGRVAKGTTLALVKVYDQAGDDLADDWRVRARVSSGVHGRLYPESIDTERIISTDIAVEIGPNPTKPQGRMAFETGSANQPPHPDGQNAADRMIPLIERRVSTTIADLLDQL